MIPEDGLTGIKVEYLPVFLGDYTVEIAVTDIFDNQSDILNFPVLVLEDITKLPKTPTLAISQNIAGELRIRWMADCSLWRLRPILEANGPRLTMPISDSTKPTDWSFSPHRQRSSNNSSA